MGLIAVFFVFFWLCGPFGRLVLRWGGSVTDHQYFLLLNQTYVLSNVRPELFIVYSCPCFSLCVIFIFYNRHSFFYLLYLIFKRIFHLGGLVSYLECTPAVTCHLQNGSAFAFLHLLNTILGLWIFNAYSKYFITECEWFKFCR